AKARPNRAKVSPMVTTSTVVSVPQTRGQGLDDVKVLKSYSTLKLRVASSCMCNPLLQCTARRILLHARHPGGLRARAAALVQPASSPAGLPRRYGALPFGGDVVSRGAKEVPAPDLR